MAQQQLHLPGDFSFIENELRRTFLTHDYQAIEKIGKEAWDAFKNHKPNESFWFETKSKTWDIIHNNLWNGHTGPSISMSLRTMEFIAQNSWEDYVFLVRN